MDRSRIPSFYKLTVDQRVRVMRERGLLSSEDCQALLTGKHTLDVHAADKMIENVIGVMGLPVGLGLNFLVNGKDYVVPLAVEEPSIVAALSSAAKTVRQAGGFETSSTDPILIGQVQVVEVPHIARAQAAILQRKEEILNLANSLHPKMVARGGGAKDLEVHIHPSEYTRSDMLVVHLLVDTRDAMGANLVNTMCEGVASLIETITGGKVFLRILSNLADRSLVRARCVIPPEHLARDGFDGEQVRDGIIIANEFAVVDPYRAVTHNKGIMNGIDAVALASGNDWRAIEASCHAWAARSGRYSSLTRWYKDDDGNLVGEIEVPLKVGIVGGSLLSNPTVAVNHRLLGVKTATELAELMAAVGLAQNFSAIRALSTEGIQQGHMTLHARSVASTAGAPPELFDTVVERLIESGEIKVWKAREIIAEVQKQATAQPVASVARADDKEPLAAGYGKIILFGEHAAVYGRHALAAPIPLAIQARVSKGNEGVEVIIPRWNVETRLHEPATQRQGFHKQFGIILGKLGLEDRPMRIEIFPNVPRAMGLGGSAAFAVAVIRALDRHFALGLSDEEVNDLAFESETVAHGTPSGIDNTMATFGRLMLYRKGNPPLREFLTAREPVKFVIGMTGVETLTHKTVTRVRQNWERNTALYERIFNEIDEITLQGTKALQQGNLEEMGDLMNVCQGLLNALQVSSWELEELLQIARDNGALGAKLTGGGGGGSMIALCPDNAERVMKAMRDKGYQAMEVTVGG
ncbi:MAG TPA: hydroxymethylglutaryl-CoA reductase, degradative [Gammaproteobacteria bacterium]|nr:hydroxymethylglutaryl-CoA reductase, degradative [Gammaproteobacteria bacterium]